MNADWQTLAALGVVVITAALLGWRWWRRRGGHAGCDCPGARGNPEFSKLKKRLGRG